MTTTTTPNSTPNPIIRYVVRVPGEASWSEHRTLRAALKEAAVANRISRPGHKVYAKHANGDATGPYSKECL